MAKKNARSLSYEKRKSHIKPGSKLSIRRQCQLLAVQRSGVYYQPKTKSREFQIQEKALAHRIESLQSQFPSYGYRKITQLLRKQGLLVNTKKVRRIRREKHLKAIYPGPNLSKARKDHYKYPYLLNKAHVDAPNTAWCADISYVKVKNVGWVYLMAIIDCYSRYIVSYKVSICQDIHLCTTALEQALARSKPYLFNTDQGSQFTSKEFTSLLEQAHIKISMNGKGRCLDNIFIERFFRSIKYECLYLYEFSTVKEAKELIDGYIHFYNNDRLHQSLGYHTPAEVYFAKDRHLAA